MRGIDLKGQRFGRLVVIEHRGVNDRKPKDNIWLCRCDCGEETVVRTAQLRRGKTRSCGCLKKEVHAEGASKRFRTHGLSRHPLYLIWSGMMSRCHNEANKSYPNYGGRGIKVCDRWHDMKAFVADVLAEIGPKPTRNSSLDRIDNDGDYKPGNIRWAGKQAQANNTRANRLIEWNGATRTLAEWTRLMGVNESAIRDRLDNLGWSVEKALTTPISTSHRKRGKAAHRRRERP